MGISANWKSWCAVATACLFLLQSCATIIRGTSQEIPVTSNPVGARIIVDGEEMGMTPLSVRLARKKAHLIRIEKEGYVPLEIRAMPHGASGRVFFVLGNFIWGLLAALPSATLVKKGIIVGLFNPEEGKSTTESGAILALLGLIVGWAGSIAIDSATGATRTLKPEDLNVTLEKAAEGTRSDTAVLIIHDWENIKWIRVACAGSGAPASSILLK